MVRFNNSGAASALINIVLVAGVLAGIAVSLGSIA